MRFFVTDRRWRIPQNEPYPFVILENDNWDDYSFRTFFYAVLHLSKEKIVELRGVKILKHGQESGRTQVMEVFEQLDESYCSLGQELAYYESLVALPEEIRNTYLRALRDVAADSSIREMFRREPGFETSLLRFGSAERALEDAPALLEGMEEENQDLSFTFHTTLGSNEFAVEFRYTNTDEIPGRINAIIGYNGTGKTHLLTNLAWVARADLHSRRQEQILANYGRLGPFNLRFGRIVAISYSAFDTFALPTNLGDNEQFGYTYCGLRRHSEQGTARGLKDADDIAEEIESAIARIDTPLRRTSLTNAMQPLQSEPSFRRIGHNLDLFAGINHWRDDFRILSAGHKISINIIVQLVSFLQRRSLVLIDEPESHLHPPLLAALMKGIGIALETHESVAIVATHSPVVLQEIPGSCAHVLQRHGSQSVIERPSVETFGENIGLLTSHVFSLDNTRSDYVGILRALAGQYSLEDIEGLFDNGLSSQARALIMQMQGRV